ncbi:hypothetical protein [Roseibium aquae]|uniref:hypothetical protein n=1 Tax=Roseibium aquae TaxID=1323746 RepID=UPI0015624B14|nr:hypothetical protein [Roseibium aquae]
MTSRTEAPPCGSLVWTLLSDYCAARGYGLRQLDEYGHGGVVFLPDGDRRFFRGTHFDLNPLGASEIADDKGQSLALLAAEGLPVPAGCLLHGPSDERVRQAQDFARDQGYPLFLKPNEGQEGEDVFRICGPDALQDHVALLAAKHRLLLLQEEIAGEDFRLVVLDGRVVLAVLREPPAVKGDGRTQLSDLIARKAQVSAGDPRVAQHIGQQGVDLGTVLEEGRALAVLPNANLSAGGTGKIVTDGVSGALKDAATKAARASGLRYAGVDFIVCCPGTDAERFTLLEINAAPGLSCLAAQGAAEQSAVAAVYRAVFDTLVSG